MMQEIRQGKLAQASGVDTAAPRSAADARASAAANAPAAANAKPADAAGAKVQQPRLSFGDQDVLRTPEHQ